MKLLYSDFFLGGMIVLKTKKEFVEDWISKEAIRFRCIHCQEELFFRNNGLSCSNHHQFDLARQGYLFLAKKPSQSQYSNDLFKLRRQIILESPFYDKLHQTIAEIILDYKIHSILDAGCGEGSHLYRLAKLIEDPLMLVGVDLSKEGIQLATDYNSNQMSLVADLAHLPFMDQQFDLILSILSPANYDEFKRVCKHQALIIKVIPNSGYLRELRETLIGLGHKVKRDYSNEEVYETFLKSYPQATTLEIKEKVILNLDQRANLIRMTPLTWNVSQDQINQCIQALPESISLDLTLLIAKKV